MINAGTGNPEEVQSIPLNQNVVYLKAECDFTNRKDIADFYYSLDGKTWTSIGTPLKMSYTLPHFMGIVLVCSTMQQKRQVAMLTLIFSI